MKKTLALMLAMVLALIPLCCVSALADEIGNVELYPLRVEFDDYDEANVYLKVYMRAINHNDSEVMVLLYDSEADGVPVFGGGISKLEPGQDTGNDSGETFMFSPEHTIDKNAANALRTANTVTMTVRVVKRDGYEELGKASYTLDITSLEGGTGWQSTDNYTYDDGSTDNLDFGHGGGTAPAYTPASTNYQTLKQGSKGQAVRDLQQRLTDLGYLNDKVDGSYGRNTNTAVRSFCSQNGLPIRSEATPEMQELLYSSSAQYYVEPYIPLVIGATFTKKRPDQVNYGGYDGELTISLVNRSSTRTIRGYVIYYYQTDMYGNRINLAGTTPALEEIYYNEMNRIEPGHYDDAISYMIRQYYGTYAVYVGIQKIVFDDGEIRELDLNDVDFYECVIAE